MKWPSNYEGVRRVETRWQKSSFSTDSDGNCLELASHAADMIIRESDAPSVISRFPSERLHGLLAVLKAGKADLA